MDEFLKVNTSHFIYRKEEILFITLSQRVKYCSDDIIGKINFHIFQRFISNEILFTLTTAWYYFSLRLKMNIFYIAYIYTAQKKEGKLWPSKPFCMKCEIGAKIMWKLSVLTCLMEIHSDVWSLYVKISLFL